MDKCSEKIVRKEEDKGMRGIEAYITKNIRGDEK